MKICILTQPLYNNYGGLLQAYALQIVLKSMGHEVWTEDRRPNSFLLDKLRRNNLIRKLAGRQAFVLPNKDQEAIISMHTKRFVKENIRTTVPIFDTVKKELRQYEFNAYVVGSDQVWRPCYSYGIQNYFLDFTFGQDVKRIAYATSFGVDKWEYSESETKKYSILSKKFNAISVREYSAIGLCEKYLGVTAVHVLDPTMLLDKADYINLVVKDNISESKGDLMTYVLDQSEEKQAIIEKVAYTLGLQSFEVMAHSKYHKKGGNIEECIFPPVTEWIRGFMDAKFVVADSFHGCVFSIIFEKPFIAIVNKERGTARFTSLLDMFGLTDRMVNSLSELSELLITSPIDWNQVRRMKGQKVKESWSFLRNNLNEKK